MSKCECWNCKNDAAMAWQPLGPDENTYSFTTLGSHYRGFPVVKVCELHMSRLEHRWGVTFKLKGKWFEITSLGEIVRAQVETEAKEMAKRGFYWSEQWRRYMYIPGAESGR